jgi:hypothetical protein
MNKTFVPWYFDVGAWTVRLWVSQRKPRIMIDDDAHAVKDTCMKTCDGRMVDEPCTRKCFLDNWWT